MNKNSIICNFIHDNPNDWEELLEKMSVKVSHSDNLAIFNYGLILEENKNYVEGGQEPARIPIFCDFSNPIVQEARGIIIDLNNLEVVCWPFRKFGNHIKSYIDNIDWSTAKVQEKVDGSIMKLWYNKDKWVWSSNGCIDTFELRNMYDYKWGDLIESSVNYTNIDFDKLDKNNTYIFELVSPNNKIIVPYDSTKLYHLGTRSNITGEEYDIDIGIEKPQEYKIHSLDEAIEAAEKLNSKFGYVKKEGFVVVDANYNRIKVKSPDYLTYHRLVNNGVLRKKNIIPMILNEDFDKEAFIIAFPEFKSIIKYYEFKIAEKYQQTKEMIAYTRSLDEEYSHERKAVALKIKGHPLSGVGFKYLTCKDDNPENYWKVRELINIIPEYEPPLISKLTKEEFER